MSMPFRDGSVWFGRYSDGRSAASRMVEVRLPERGVEIGLDRAEPLTWPYGALASASPLSARSGDVLLSYSYAPGATLFVADHTFVARLVGHAPQLTARAQRWRIARPWMAVAAVALVVAGGVWAAGLSPAHGLARLLPDRARAALGEQVVASMIGSRRNCAQPQGVAALDTLSRRLSTASGSDSRFKVVVVDWQLLNAFAAPGEQIVLTRELIERAASADEVAAVLAHEMGHGLELHPETGIIRALGLSAVVELLTGGGTGGLATVGLVLAQLSYTRGAEREADAHALRILKGAGISPQGIVDFFRRVEKLEGTSPTAKTVGRLDILRTHPQSAERARIAAEQPAYPTKPALAPEAWAALKAICAGAANEKPASRAERERT